MDRYAESLSIAVELEDKPSVASTLHQAGLLLAANGDAAEARRYYEAALGIARKIDDRRLIGVILGALGQVALTEKNVSEARSCWEESLKILTDLGAAEAQTVADWLRAIETTASM
jgi:tetratricopeptide (TPR) repeat protein